MFHAPQSLMMPKVSCDHHILFF